MDSNEDKYSMHSQTTLHAQLLFMPLSLMEVQNIKNPEFLKL